MNSVERVELCRLLRLRGTIAKADLKARGAEQLAIVEQQLAAKYRENDPRWSDLAKRTKEALRQVDADLATRCEEAGIPAEFRPGFTWYWCDRGENAIRERRAELRAAAQAQIEAAVKRACVEVDRAVMHVQTQLVEGVVQSSDGRQFLDAIPSIEALLPAPSLDALESVAANGTATRRALLRRA